MIKSVFLDDNKTVSKLHFLTSRCASDIFDKFGAQMRPEFFFKSAWFDESSVPS